MASAGCNFVGESERPSAWIGSTTQADELGWEQPVMPHLLHNNDELNKLYPPLTAPDDLDGDGQEVADLDDITLQVGQAIAARIAQQAADFGRRRTPQNDGPSPRSEAPSAHDNDRPLPRRVFASDCPSVAGRPVTRSREVPSAHDRSLPRRTSAQDRPSVARRPVARSCDVPSINDGEEPRELIRDVPPNNNDGMPHERLCQTSADEHRDSPRASAAPSHSNTKNALTSRKEMLSLREAVQL